MKYPCSCWLFVYLVCVNIPFSLSDSDKLQIGVKKRIENCVIKAQKGDILHIHYIGKLTDGTVFDDSYKRGEPLVFNLGSGNVIKGWDQGIVGMCEEEKRVLRIPPELAYGKAGAPPDIPPDSPLKFDIELVKIIRRNEF